VEVRARLAKVSSIVGTVTRKLPGSTEAAHALATASMTVIAENSRRAQHQRQMIRMRNYYASGGKFGFTAADLSSDSEKNSGSDSDSDSDEDKGGAHRPAERTNSGLRKVSRESSAATDTEGVLQRLSEEVHCQRRLLKATEVEEFDMQWGLDPSGDFAQGERSLLPCFKGKPGAEQTLMAELQFVTAESAKKVDKLNIATDAHTGLEILHLFIKDLLGRDTPAAIIFETKSEEDFKHTKVVTRTSKRLAILALVMINAFFVYYAMLTGFRKGLAWQRVYLLACIIQFVVEIVLFETMECVWINCAIPVLVSGEVRRVSDSITEVVRNLCVDTVSESRIFLNAPDYLFVSTNVAKKFPDLMESILVQAYATHLPGELARKWQVGSIARSHRHDRLRNVTLLSAMFGIMQYLGTAPFVLHRMFIRFVQPFVFSGLVLLWRLIASDPIYLIIAGGVLALSAALLVRKYYQHRSVDLHVKTVAPVFAEYGTGLQLSTIEAELNESDSLHKPTLPRLARAPQEPSQSSASSRRHSESSESKSERAGDEASSASSNPLSSALQRGPRRSALRRDIESSDTSSHGHSTDVSTLDTAVRPQKQKRAGPRRVALESVQSSDEGSSASSRRPSSHRSSSAALQASAAAPASETDNHTVSSSSTDSTGSSDESA
jgi:hypothetical protein